MRRLREQLERHAIEPSYIFLQRSCRELARWRVIASALNALVFLKGS
jgi:hypothetical protein